MSAYVKSIDKSHLLEVGMEGFYGESMPEKKQNNPGYEVGTDFISNNLIPQIDFATIHLYPDQWYPGSNEAGRLNLWRNGSKQHIDDSKSVLRKPILVTEFGKSSRSSGYNVQSQRQLFREHIQQCLQLCTNRRRVWRCSVLASDGSRNGKLERWL
ncbi:putative mannan endo-1 4-beta-mannosidase 9 [Phtheirospermum japonicum]|uniref:mannan endo-1,4-beta-mannosidase n=1 Tax=Phtheirospermum japonicum TaxID=374723 RepID=A0A830CQQ9_9LAMI|nr:putative mannan endo-1 4-beta-mannosidase 9 [Phtheirospermum japonicum]